ncbi:U3 small nucleolar RNA-associated protein 6 homolog [Microplitis mediator]|uniref:U3 small nucleolar RNA-associated protein 6 homolog n=1 Tax=Microplitis mediator TaxID=375433 RepID=UPI002553F930|nr:U3 small nucleolar RNA-associated protein 6 homolog [Microplitis mediator]
MAEFVEKGCEEMILALEQMKRIKLFEDNEIQKIVKNLKDHEYKIGRLIKSKDDFLSYFSYLMVVLNLVKQRRAKLGIKEKKASIDFCIIKKIKVLYRRARMRFQSDLSFWIDLMKLSKTENFQEHLPGIADRMLKVHQDKPGCWHISAQWHMKETKDVDRARKYLLKGLHFHPESQLLYKDLLQLELTEASSSKDDTPVESKHARLIYQQAYKYIKDVNFIIELLDIASKYKDTKDLQKIIMDDLVENFSDEPKMWDTWARREFKGLSYSSNQDDDSPSGKSKKKPLRDRLNSAIEVYESAVKLLPTKTMWSLYINFLLEINKDNSTLPNYKRKLLKAALTQGHEEKNLEEKYYWIWIKLSKNDKKDSWKKLYDILSSATEALPESIELWKKKISFLFLNSDEDDLALSEFNKAIKILGNKALPLWKIKLSYIQAKHPDKLKDFFETVMQEDPAISCEMKPLYIDWLAAEKGIKATRRVYNKLCIQPPFNLELHRKMASIELSQPEINKVNARYPHEMATLQFGKTNVDVWIEYVTFETNYGDLLNISSIHQRAIKTLNPIDADNFISKFELLKINSEPMEI